MSTFTPGPWFGIVDGRYADTEWNAENDMAQVSTVAPISDASGKTLALVVSEGWDDSELDANARLIAAAPDLLEACESARDVLHALGQNFGGSFEQIERAIAKARGEA
jgi:hypothetical protein